MINKLYVFCNNNYPYWGKKNCRSLRLLAFGAEPKKIEPVIRMLGQQQKILLEQQDRGPTLSEIVGGIGWILGLVGVTAFFMGRSRS
jgi:nickel transport protein